MNKNYYDILGIKKGSTDAEIKKAYKKLAMQYHPDRNKGDKKAEEKFKEVNEAYQTLSDPTKKKNYDQFGSADFSGFSGNRGGAAGNPFSGGGFSGENIEFDLGDIFSAMGGGSTRAGSQGFGGFDFADIFSGGGAPRQQRRTSEESRKKTPDEAPVLDVIKTVSIPFLDFLIDTSVSVETVYGKSVTLKIKAGTKPGTKFRIKGKGRTESGKTGDMFVIVDAKMPRVPLDPRVAKMLEAIRYEV